MLYTDRQLTDDAPMLDQDDTGILFYSRHVKALRTTLSSKLQVARHSIKGNTRVKLSEYSTQTR